jgi:hypothetical protein
VGEGGYARRIAGGGEEKRRGKVPPQAMTISAAALPLVGEDGGARVVAWRVCGSLILAQTVTTKLAGVPTALAIGGALNGTGQRCTCCDLPEVVFETDQRLAVEHQLLQLLLHDVSPVALGTNPQLDILAHPEVLPAGKG